MAPCVGKSRPASQPLSRALVRAVVIIVSIDVVGYLCACYLCFLPIKKSCWQIVDLGLIAIMISLHVSSLIVDRTCHRYWCGLVAGPFVMASVHLRPSAPIDEWRTILGQIQAWAAPHLARLGAAGFLRWGRFQPNAAGFSSRGDRRGGALAGQPKVLCH